MKKIIIPTIVLIFILLPLIHASQYSHEEAVTAIELAENNINELRSKGYSVKSLEDLLNEAKMTLERADFAEVIRNNSTSELAEEAKKALEGLDYQGFNYDEVIYYTNSIQEKFEELSQSSDKIRAFEIEVESYKDEKNSLPEGTLSTITGLVTYKESTKSLTDTSEAEDLLKQAREAFEKERFEEANSLVEQAQANLEEKEAKVTVSNILLDSSKNFIEKNYISIFIFLAASSLLIIFIFHFVQVKRLKRTFESLKKERKSLNKLMKKTQKERFHDGKMSKMIYNVRMNNYQKRLAEIEEEIPVLRSKLK